MGNLTGVYSKQNMPENNKRICIFVLFCFLNLFNVGCNSKVAHGEKLEFLSFKNCKLHGDKFQNSCINCNYSSELTQGIFHGH